MSTGIAYILLMALVIAPAIYGMRQLREWREGDEQLNTDKKLFLGGLFSPLVIFAVIIVFYLVIMLWTLG